MTVQIASLAVLLAMFLLASFVQVNLGILALVAAFVVGVGFGGLDIDAMLAGFPADLLVLLVGVTYLFGIAQTNGTLERVVDLGVRLVRGRVALMPWLLFVLTAFVAAVGALSAAAVAIVAPIAMRFAQQYRISPLLTGLMVVQGATAGSFSPLSPFGAITGQLLTGAGLPDQQPWLFINSFVFNFVLGIVVFCVFGGVRLFREGRRDEPDAGPGPESSGGAVATATTATTTTTPAATATTATTQRTRFTVHQALTLTGLAGLVVASTALSLDVGFTALTIGLVLTLLAPKDYAEAISRIPWSAVLLVCGVITYVGVLDELGTIDFLRELITSGGSPLLTALAAAYIGGVISAFASTAGVLGASIPLTVPLLDDGTLPLLGTITAIGIASSVVDVSPLSTNGALLVANQQSMDSRVFFRRLIMWAVPVIALAPGLSWFVFVVL
ncbi:SLC13 family permease [Prauserella cavernicola]|uniref:SLC13 family permease n=1 Tax=Prauserella cavernicola TaxID=2800127 RepID=A0A934V3N7_9PSEU|nr:SLC13 family permease [Prauserella cavernicola]MBK1783235.1 SLC13 family permease [Prauserella cavernicola]